MDDLSYSSADFTRMLNGFIEYLTDEGWLGHKITEQQAGLVAVWLVHEQDYMDEQADEETADE